MSRSRGAKKGLLTPDNCVVAIIDLQPQMLFGVANFDRQTDHQQQRAFWPRPRAVFGVPVV